MTLGPLPLLVESEARPGRANRIGGSRNGSNRCLLFEREPPGFEQLESRGVPVYEYKCRVCSQHFDVEQSFSDDTLTEIDGCAVHESGRHQVKKVFAAPAIAFKGDGFYRNDARGSNGKDSTVKDSSTTSSSTDSSSSSDSVSPSTSSETSSSDSGSSKSSETTKTSSSTSTAD